MGCEWPLSRPDIALILHPAGFCRDDFRLIPRRAVLSAAESRSFLGHAETCTLDSRSRRRSLVHRRFRFPSGACTSLHGSETGENRPCRSLQNRAKSLRSTAISPTGPISTPNHRTLLTENPPGYRFGSVAISPFFTGPCTKCPVKLRRLGFQKCPLLPPSSMRRQNRSLPGSSYVLTSLRGGRRGRRGLR